MPPTVAVILAVLNEQDHIDACLASLVGQTQVPDEIIIADGGSVDRTEELLEEWRRRHPQMIRLIDNPDQHQAAGLTAAGRIAQSEILVRADGHTVFDETYIARSLAALESSDAVAVGGAQRGRADDGVAAAVAAAMTSRLATGPAPYRHADTIREVDTVYLGAFRRSDFLAMGGFRRLPSGAAEDADLYYRWRERGRKVLFDPSILSSYHPRASWSSLARQYWKYGVAKADMRALHGEFPHARPYLPALLVFLLASLFLGGLVTGQWLPFLVVAGFWLVALAYVALSVSGSLRVRAGAGLAAAIMHLSYGSGLLIGLWRPSSKVLGETQDF